MLNKLKYYLFILGCQMNKSDAERLATLLESLGLERTDQESDANIIAVVACSVRQAAVNRIRGRIGAWRQMQQARPVDNPLLTILTGCVLVADRKIFAKQFDLVVETGEVGRKLMETLNLSTPPMAAVSALKLPTPATGRVEISSADFFALNPQYSSPFQAYIPIQTGCNNFCSYCAVPYTKGRERYRGHQEIWQEVSQLVKKGYKEITLLGQNVNTYFDPTLKAAIGQRTKYRQWSALTDFPRLLRLIADIPGDWWLRFMTSNPWDMSDETIKAVADCQKICEYIHLPIQSGSDRVLKLMNRHHTQKDYLELIDKIRSQIPGVAISTDIIVGFPGETEADFMATAKVMEYAQYDMAYIARYSPRPGTVAAEHMVDDVAMAEKQRREKYLEGILRKTAVINNEKYVGREAEVLVEKVKSEKLKVKSHSSKLKVYYGKTRTYKTVKFKTDRECVGQLVKVKITRADDFGLEGKVKP